LDIWPTLTAGAKSPHDVILLNTTPQVGAVRVGEWKLIVNHGETRGTRAKGAQRGKETVQLFNLIRDPYEKTNLANDQPEKVKQLRQALAKLAKEAVPPKAAPEPKGFKAPTVWGEARG
jgi:arylsulfatase A-like enzyme